jgi:hypothetical protein
MEMGDCVWFVKYSELFDVGVRMKKEFWFWVIAWGKDVLINRHDPTAMIVILVVILIWMVINADQTLYATRRKNNSSVS